MSPSVIAKKAAGAGMDAAAISDHNTALNCRSFEVCCRKEGVTPIYGIEVTSLEEAHILCLFSDLDAAEDLGRIIYDKLPDIPNNPEKFGDQIWVDEDENILGELEKYLISAAELSLDQLIELVHDRDGLFIPAHIDKPVFSIPSQLGFLPPMDYDALETTVLPCPVETGKYRLIQNSDAHYPDDIAKRFTILEAAGSSGSAILKSVKTPE